MLKNHFYSHLIDTEDFIAGLDNLGMSDKEREELLNIARVTIHHVIIDAVLITLPSEHHDKFLDNLMKEDHQKTWRHLEKNTEGLAEKIKEAFAGVKDLFLSDVSLVRHPAQE